MLSRCAWGGRQLCLVVAVSLIMLLNSACQETAALPESSASTTAVTIPTIALTPTPDRAGTAALNQGQQETPGSVELPAFSLVDVSPTILPTDLPQDNGGSVAQMTPSPTPSPTPQPTFTPPALPFTSTNEHYWLRRPIAEGGTVWTDKAYPYGGTRGGTLRPHHGVEFYVPTGTEILAAASGTVVVAGADDEQIYGPHRKFYGNLVVIELDPHFIGQPVYTLYGHLSEIFVEEGQRVDSEEIIALSGATGVADGSHLHFEVRVGQNDYGSTRNPLLWLYPFPDHGVVVGQVTWPSGELVQGAQLFLRRVDAPSKYAETTTYTVGDISLNADEGWQENFAFDDVEAGYYEIEVRRGSREIKEEVWVYPYRTSAVEITLDW